jgi:release factor glutamine methyltransferase
MHTVASARIWAIQELKGAREKSPVLSADLLIASVLGWDRVRVLSHTEESISQASWERLQDLVLRRAKGEPLQYLTGVQEFYGMAFHVEPDVLIPRPETEILAEKAIQLMQSSPSGARFLDIGTGSGCIAVSVAHEVPTATGWAVDISAGALEVARRNAIQHGVNGRLLLIRSNLIDCFPRTPSFDFVFCNPPYVALQDYDSLPREVREHEPSLALFSGDTGLDLYRALIPEVPSRLVPGGYLLLEIGLGQAEKIRLLVEEAGLSVETILNDLQGIPRCLVGCKPPGVGDG